MKWAETAAALHAQAASANRLRLTAAEMLSTHTDCFGLTVDDDTTADDIYMSYYICNGMYCVNMPVESGDSVVPVYGCYTAH